MARKNFNRETKAKPEDSMRKILRNNKWIPIKPVLYVGTTNKICGFVDGLYIPYKLIGPVKV